MSGVANKRSKIKTFLPTFILAILGIASIITCLGLYYRTNSSACKDKKDDEATQCTVSSWCSTSMLSSGCLFIVFALIFGIKPLIKTVKHQ
jgi:hypothetical protein